MATPVAVISLLLVAAVSLLIIRTGTIALVMTGMATEVASFQASSAFSGAGFTTDETERALATPQRRAIVKTLIRAGSIGIVTAVASLALSFSRTNRVAGPRFTYLVGGAVVLGLFARSRWFNRLITPGIEWALNRTTSLEFRDYTYLLEFQEDYRVAELKAKDNDWLVRGPLGSLNLDAEGVMILGINRRDGSYVSPPDPDYILESGDTLTVYGKKTDWSSSRSARVTTKRPTPRPSKSTSRTPRRDNSRRTRSSIRPLQLRHAVDAVRQIGGS